MGSLDRVTEHDNLKKKSLMCFAGIHFAFNEESQIVYSILYDINVIK